MTANETRESGASRCPTCGGFLMTGCNKCGDGLVPVTCMVAYQKKRRSLQPPTDAVGPEHAL